MPPLSPAPRISLAETEADFEAARDLCRHFQRFFTARLAPIIDLVDRYYPPDSYEAMLANLPVEHARPRGAILLGRIDGRAMGCAMLRPSDDPGAVEVKRMFVHEEARGTGLGRALMRACFARAAADGYRAMRLDTSYLQTEAQRLYESEGFHRRGPYYDAPADVEEILYFYERALDAAEAAGAP